MIEEIKILLSILTTAAVTGIPLYYKYRQVMLKLKEKEAEVDIKVKTEESKLHNTEELNKESAWKRLLEIHEAENTKLRARDDAQEKKLDDLMERNIQCQRSEAALTERLKATEDRVRFLEEKILVLLQTALTPKQETTSGQK